jgi:basic membrane protein A and related proteins
MMGRIGKSVLASICVIAAVSAYGAPAKVSFALVTSTPRGDHSFVDAACSGAEKAIKELSAKGKIIESQGIADQEAAMRSAISLNYDIVLAPAVEAETVLSLAKEFPDQKFGVPSDIFVEKLPPNVAAFQINTHEGSFLAGLIAGKLTKTNVVGAVVGGDGPGLNIFFYGYQQGVLTANPKCKVLVSYLGFDFSNPTLGKETALSQYQQGADIIYQIAGRSGEGVISAAKEKGLFAIGVDSNQDDIAPGNVIVSMMKRVDMTSYLLVKNVQEGKFQSGFQVIGLKEGGVGLSWDSGSKTFEQKGPKDMVAKLPAVKKLVAEYKAKILNGTFKVRNALEEAQVK